MAANGNGSGSSNPLGSLPGLRGRRGGIATRGNRLPSLRTPRDLTLGGSQKRSFTPNIPNRRDKPAAQESEESKPAPQVKSTKDNKNKRGRNERGRGRGRGRGDLIQSHSIFEDGPSAASNIKRSVGDSYDRPTSSASGGTRTIKQERKDPEEQSRILSQLMKDDFITDHSAESEPGMTPTLLPLSTRSAYVKPQVKVKEDPIEDDVDDKKSVLSDATPSPAPSPSVLNTAGITPSHLFTKSLQTPASDGELLVIQLPDTLPGEPAYTEEEEKEARDKSKQKAQGVEEELTQKLKKCSLSEFQEGLVGKLRIHRSGRTTLQLGTVSLDVTMGTPASFLQEVVSVYAEGEEGNMTVLGNSQHKLLCVPDFESLLDQAAFLK